ncbi:unnamed protein product [Didymodactylos carnosus]|uniref:Uncharacterized protein n=1 Tax=Didymodactylos carnosus TaxID=1234261 RepID=A0A816ERD5_9BILA|nr:unnamed protein product [Didymodactylos carnosus]CAF4595704.1 unnamed protein product [Didymodactylos carnosus]
MRKLEDITVPVLRHGPLPTTTFSFDPDPNDEDIEKALKEQSQRNDSPLTGIFITAACGSILFIGVLAFSIYATRERTLQIEKDVYELPIQTSITNSSISSTSGESTTSPNVVL